MRGHASRSGTETSFRRWTSGRSGRGRTSHTTRLCVTPTGPGAPSAAGAATAGASRARGGGAANPGSDATA